LFRVIIFGDDALTLGGVREAIADKNDTDVRVLGVPPENMSQLQELPAPDVFIVCMNSVTAGTIDALRRFIVADNGRQVPVLLLTTSTGEQTAALLRLGCCVISRQQVQPHQLGVIARLVAFGYLFVQAQELNALLAEASHIGGAQPERTEEIIKKLTPREQVVFGLVSQGMTNPEVACSLSIARSTVKSHVENILEKLGMRSRTEIVFCSHSGRSTFADLGGEGYGVFPGQPEEADFPGCWLVGARCLKSGGDDDAAELGGHVGGCGPGRCRRAASSPRSLSQWTVSKRIFRLPVLWWPCGRW
jgi:DNA-binding NarL/FixJ family response regulator